MKYVVIGIYIVVVAVSVALLVYRKKKMSILEGKKRSDQDSSEMIEKQTYELSPSDKNPDELVIQIEMLPVEAIPDEGKLVEITDSRVLAHVNNLVPGLFNDDINFRAIDEKTVSMITDQVSGQSLEHFHDTSDLYAEDVQLISKAGKIYYLPMNKAE